jgi:hypothetical protein
MSKRLITLMLCGCAAFALATTEAKAGMPGGGQSIPGGGPGGGGSNPVCTASQAALCANPGGAKLECCGSVNGFSYCLLQGETCFVGVVGRYCDPHSLNNNAVCAPNLTCCSPQGWPNPGTCQPIGSCP